MRIDFIKRIGSDGVEFSEDATDEQKQLVEDYLEKSPESVEEILQYLNLKIALNTQLDHGEFIDDFYESLRYFFDSYESELSDPSLESEYESDSINFGEAHDPTQAGPSGFLGYGDCCTLNIRSLRSLAKYLILITTVSKFNRVTEGHYEYWRFTGAIAQALEELIYDSSNLREETSAGTSLEETSFFSEGDSTPQSFISQDLPLLLQVALLGKQKHQATIKNHPASENMDDSFSNIIANNFQLATRHGFPTLEGVAGYYSSNESSSSLQNKMEDWARTTSNPETQKSLQSFHQLKNYEIEDIRQQVHDNSFGSHCSDSLNWGEGFFRKLHEPYRVDSLHGSTNYSGPAVIVSTLCCLAFWDLVEQEQLDVIKERLEADISNPEPYKETRLKKEWTIFDFYHWENYLHF